MKTKKFNKRLSLNKKTIANLSIGEQARLRGGNRPPPPYSEEPTYCGATYEGTCGCGTDTCGCIPTTWVNTCDTSC